MGLVVANFMDSSLVDLKRKGVFESVAEAYNPNSTYDAVLHFTPHECDLRLAPDMKAHRIELIAHPVSGLQPRKIFATILRTAVTVRRRRVHIVRGRLPYLGSLIGATAARLTGRPSVVSLGGDNRIGQERTQCYYLGNRRLSYAIEWLTLRLVDRIVVPNQFTTDYVASIIGRRLAKKKCVVIPWISPPVPSFDPEDGAQLARLRISDKSIVIPIIGFVNRYKFADTIFDALADGPIELDGRHALFCFLGDGPLLASGKTRFANRNDVRFFGWQQRSVVHTFLRRADLVLIPMSGFVLLEAASLGKLVVSSRLEWHSELVQHGETGYLVDPTQPAAWRQAIERSLQDAPHCRKEMGCRLRDRYRDGFTPETAIAREIALYESLVRKRPSGNDPGCGSRIADSTKGKAGQ